MEIPLKKKWKGIADGWQDYFPHSINSWKSMAILLNLWILSVARDYYSQWIKTESHYLGSKTCFYKHSSGLEMIGFFWFGLLRRNFDGNLQCL